MKAIYNILLLAILGLTLGAKLKKNIKLLKCQGLGFDCDWEAKCCEGYYCVNDRCQKTKGEDTLKYTPDGERCNVGHLCPKDYKCESHRCVLMSDVVIDKIIEQGRKRLQNEYTSI